MTSPKPRPEKSRNISSDRSTGRTKNDWSDRAESLSEQVVTYLSANSEQAFTRAEIATTLNVDPNAVSTALSRLESRDLVSHKGEYWAITEDRERVRAAYDIHAASVALDMDDGGIDVDAWDDATPDEPHPSEQDTDADSEDCV